MHKNKEHDHDPQTRDAIFKVLQKLNIHYDVQTHRPLFTSQDAAKYRPHIQGGACKNLFARNKKGDVHYLIIADPKSRVDLRSLRKEIGASALSFASERRLADVLQVKPGSVSPLGLVFAKEHSVRVVVDKALLDHSHLNFHPNINTETVCLSVDDLKRFLEWTEQEVIYTGFATE